MTLNPGQAPWALFFLCVFHCDIVCDHIAKITQKKPLNSTDAVQIEHPQSVLEQSTEAPLCNQQDPKDFLSTSWCQTPQEVPYVQALKVQAYFGSIRGTYTISHSRF